MPAIHRLRGKHPRAVFADISVAAGIPNTGKGGHGISGRALVIRPIVPWWGRMLTSHGCGTAYAPTRWIQQLIVKRPSVHSPEGTSTGSTSWRSQLGKTTRRSVSAMISACDASPPRMDGAGR